MNLTMLGSGTSVPHPRRAAPAFWLDTTEAVPYYRILAPTRHTGWLRNNSIGQTSMQFGLVIFTSIILGLAPFLFALKWSPQTQSRTKPLHIFGPHCLAALLNAINDANNYRLLTQAFAIELREVGSDTSSKFCRAFLPRL